MILVLVCIPIIIVVIKKGLLTRLVKALTQAEPPAWIHYTNMPYKGYIIEWDYQVVPLVLSVLCPACRCIVSQKPGSGYTYCPKCDTYFPERLYEQDFEDIRKIIERNIRMGDYPKG
jgi:hypothetical protein